MADFPITVELLSNPTVSSFKNQITSMVNELNRDLPKIRVELDQTSLNTMRSQIERLLSAVNASNNSIRNIGGGGNGNNNNWFNTNQQQLRRMAEVARQARELLNKNTKAGDYESVRRINDILPKVEKVLASCGGRARDFGKALKENGMSAQDADRAITQLVTGISTLNQELSKGGKGDNLQLTAYFKEYKRVADKVREANAFLTDNSASQNTASYQAIIPLVRELTSAFEACNGEARNLDASFRGLSGEQKLAAIDAGLATLKTDLKAAEQAAGTSLDKLVAKRNELGALLQKAPASMVGTEAHTQLLAQYQLFDGIIKQCQQDANLLGTAVQNSGKNSSELFKGATDAVKQYSDALNKANKEAEKAAQSTSNTQSTKKIKDYATVQREYTKAVTAGEKALLSWNAAERSQFMSSREAYANLSAAVDNAHVAANAYDGTAESVNRLAAANDSLNRVYRESKAVIVQNGDATQSLRTKLSNLATKFSSWLTVSQVIMFGVRAIKSAISESIALQDAFAQLQIVTGASNDEMVAFKDTTVDLAQDLGKSVTDVAKSIETFSRLGYNLGDASELAKYANILANVASVSSDEATTGLTSIIKGYNMRVEDAAHVADVLVEVGQKYAVSAAEMMEAYEKSGAALNATNTSFEKSAGLIAAANAAVQDSSVVGTALKTVSARIRGSKTDLEELGESTDDLADGFSKYAKEIQALTGVDIMVEGTTDTFKNMYDIMNDIAGVWDKLTDTQKARTSEILGGKHMCRAA